MKIVTVVGARPQFVKAATISRAILEHNKTHPDDIITEVIVHTGQHYDANMSDVFFDEMKIPKPNYTLGVGGSSHGAMTGRQLEKIEEVLIQEKPNCVLVYGDTNSTIAGALAAAKIHIPVVHVEAGLRSFNMRMPEEINRILTDQISSLLLCPTDKAVENLYKEGFDSKQCDIINAGDVMYDAALFYAPSARKPTQLQSEDGFVLCTIHRAENTDDESRLLNIIEALNEVNRSTPVVCPIHPRTRQLLAQLKVKPEFELLDPVGYFEMIWLLQHCSIVVTDSGGLQKEAYFFAKRCVTMRDQTEWVELIESGMNVLVGANKEKILSEVAAAGAGFNATDKEIYGNGDSSVIMLKNIKERFA